MATLHSRAKVDAQKSGMQLGVEERFIPFGINVFETASE